MQLVKRNLPSDHNLFLFGDVHDGAALSSKDGFKQLENMVFSKYDGCKNNFVAEGGDQIDAITVDDKRFGEDALKTRGEENEPIPLLQIKYAIEKRKKLASKYLYMLQGNHEDKLWRFGNLTKWMCGELKVEYGTWTTKLSVNDKKGNLLYKVFDTHGRKQISSAADDPIRVNSNMKLTLKRHLKNKAGDCAVMIKHHVHKLIVTEPQYELYLTDDGENIKQHYTSWGQNESYIHPDARWYGCAGAFLRMYYDDDISGYAEKAEYDPTQLGWLVLVVRDNKIIRLDKVYEK